MPNLRMIRRRINAVHNIQQVTRAMRMIAASRMKKAQEAIMQTRPYARRLEVLMRHMASRVPQEEHPLLAVREIRRATLVVVTGDRGLCRGFNANVIRRAAERYEALVNQGADCEIITVGRKAYDYFRRRERRILHHHVGIFQHLNFSHAQAIARQATERYERVETDLVEIVYNEFKSVLQQTLVAKHFLPLEPVEPAEQGHFVDYIYEPSKEAIWTDLVGKYLNLELWRVLLESNAAEQAARMTAMEEATKSAEDMIKQLISVRNKVRQTNITTELTEIVGASEAVE